MPKDSAKRQLQNAKDMLGISDERAEEIFQEEPDRKQKKKKQMQGKQAEEAVEETETEAESSAPNYDEIVAGTIDEAKEQILKFDSPDYDAIIQAEKENKDRTTFIDWLEKQG